MTRDIDKTANVHPTTVFEGSATVGFCSRVGHDATPEEAVRIADGVDIGAFCLIEGGAHLGAGVEIDHYCRIGWRARIGPGTRVLYRAQVFDGVVVGRDCIIAGELVDRTVVEDGVRFQGATAHTHADATGDWDDTVEPSPVIGRCSVVGVGAIVIGGITIGPRSFVAAGERVTCDVPAEHVLQGGVLRPLLALRGMIRLREI